MEEEDLIAGLPPAPPQKDEEEDLLAGLPPAAATPEEDPSLIADVARGVATAPVQFAKGITGLGAMALDQVFDTDYTRASDEFFDDVTDFIGGPEGTGGKIAQDVLVFGAGFIPIAGWLGRAGAVAKTGKSLGATSKFMKSAEAFGKTARGQAALGNRAKVLGATALGAGAYDFAISPNGRATLSDEFEILPDALKTESTEGLTGRDAVATNLRNRLRQAAEATALSGVFDTALYGLGRGSRALGSAPVVGPAASGTARLASQGWGALNRVASRVPGVTPAKDAARYYFAPYRGLDKVVANEIRDITNVRTGLKKDVASLMEQFHKKTEKLAAESAKRSGRADVMNQIKQDVGRYWENPTNAKVIEAYGPEIKKLADEVLEVDNALTDVMLTELEQVAGSAPETAVRGRQQQLALDAIETIKTNRAQGKQHLTRIYELHQDPAKLYKSLGNENLMESSFFKQAEADLLRSRKKQALKAGTEFDEKLARENVQRTLLDTLQLNPIGELTPKAIDKAIKGRLKTLRDDVVGSGRGLVAKDTPVFKLATDILQERKQITEYASVRNLLGEITDPTQRMTHMLNHMIDLDVGLQFYGQQARNAKPAAAAIQGLAEGQRPMYVYLPSTAKSLDIEQDVADLTRVLGDTETTEGLIQRAQQALRDEGYVQLGIDPSSTRGVEEGIDSILGGRYGELTGMYVPKELYDNLTAPLTLGTNPLSQVGAILSTMKSATQKMTIVPNVATRVRDVLGNQGMVIASGNATSGFGSTAGGNALTAFRAVNNLDQEGTKRLAAKLSLSGQGDNAVTTSLLRDMRNVGPAFGASEKFRRGVETIETKTPVMAPVLDFFEKTTKGVDAAAKLQVLTGEEAKLRELMNGFARSGADEESIINWMARSGMIDRTASQLNEYSTAQLLNQGFKGQVLDPVETIAADYTARFMPTYDQIGFLVRETDRLLPFGTFTSFASENIRNLFNIFEVGVKQLASEVDDELLRKLGPERAEALVKAVRGLGAQRLTGLATVAHFIPKGMVRAGMDATGMTPEQMERLHEQTDHFQKGSDIVPLEFDNNGRVKYLNLSYVAPYGFVTDSVQAALRSYNERGKLNQNEVQQLTGSAFDMIAGLSDPFASESIVFERIRDALPASGPGSLGVGRGGETQTGARVYEPSQSLGSRVAQGFGHVAESFIPAIAKLAMTTDKGEIAPGRLTRAMTETPGARGQEFSTFEELGRQITGFTPMEINLKRDFEFSGKAYSPLRSNAKGILNKTVRRSDTTPEDMLSATDSYLDSLYRSQSKLYNDILAARELGLSEQDIRRELVQDAKLGSTEVAQIMRGNFWPGTASQEVREEVMRQINIEGRARVTRNVPWSEINRKAMQRRRQPLNPELFRRRQQNTEQVPELEDSTSGSLLEGLPNASQVAAPAAGGSLFADIPDASATQAPTQQPRPRPQPTPQPETRQAPSPELLGGNLTDRIRNMELFNTLHNDE